MAKKAKVSKWPETPIVLRMIAKNVALSQWREYMETGDGGGFFSQKNPEKVAAEIFKQLSHPDAVAIVGHEWDHLTADVRLLLGTKAANGNASGNVKKGCQSLNQLIGGRLLRTQKEITASVAGRTIRIDQAKAGAQRKYGVDDERFVFRLR
jgi:hypothetical protein